MAILINENGRVIEAKAIKGHPVLRVGGRRGAEMGLQTDARREAGEAAGHSDLCSHRSAMRLVNIVAARKASTFILAFLVMSASAFALVIAAAAQRRGGATASGRGRR